MPRATDRPASRSISFISFIDSAGPLRHVQAPVSSPPQRSLKHTTAEFLAAHAGGLILTMRLMWDAANISDFISFQSARAMFRASTPTFSSVARTHRCSLFCSSRIQKGSCKRPQKSILPPISSLAFCPSTLSLILYDPLACVTTPPRTH